MRSTLILAITIVALLGGFALYFAMQPKVAAPRRAPERTATTNAPPMPTTTPAGTVAGPGDDVWVKTYDEKTGRLAFQLRAARYDPQPDGNSVKVTRPQAEIFLGDDATADARVLRIEGTDGVVVMPSDSVKRGELRSSEGAPRSGTLHNVVISLMDARDLARPLLTCRVNNVAFDNDAYRISTEMYTDVAGATVPADEVPVEVRGDEYDFDGRGLVIKWDGIDRRLSLLEIAHGERLIVKSASAMDSLADSRQDRAADAQAASHRQAAQAKAPVKSGARGAGAAAPKSSAFVYRATFASEVKVTQNDQPIALADEMLVDFLSGGDGTSMQPATQPAKREPGTRPAQRPRRADRSAATTRPAEPVIIRWVGKLRVAPRPATDSPPPLPEKFDVALRGYTQPVMINFRGSQVSCASLEHHSAGDRATFSGSPGIPLVVLRDANGAVLRTPEFAYFGEDGKAVSRGASRGEFPVQTEADRPAQLARIEWGESCQATLAGESRGTLTIADAELRGDVKLDHPQLSLSAAALKVAFEPGEDAAQKNPALKAVDASGSVHATMIDAQKKSQSITCDRLALTAAQTPQKKTVVRSMNAEGSVHAFDDEQEMYAGRIAMNLVPVPAQQNPQAAAEPAGGFAFGAAGGEVQLESLLAQQGVRLSAKSGMAASGDELRINGDGDDQRVVLLGQPVATVSDGANTIAGQNISMQPKRGEMTVPGPGRLHGVQRASADAPARAIDVEWASGLAADGRKNLIEITGDVRAASQEDDGSRQRATADKLTIALADAPKPSGPGEPPASQPALAQRQDLNPMRDKEFRGLSFDGNTQLEMIAAAGQDDGAGQREVHLFAQTATYDAIERQFKVPGAGRMLMRDDAPTTSTTLPGTQRSDPQLRGATAFEWHDRLVFDEPAGRATMSGQVVIVHQDLGPDPTPFRLEAAEVAADIASSAAADRSTKSLGPGASDFRVKRLLASEGVHFTSREIRFESATLEYDPATATLTARGTERISAQLYDDQGVSKGSFDELWFNTKTEQIRLKNPQAHIRR